MLAFSEQNHRLPHRAFVKSQLALLNRSAVSDRTRKRERKDRDRTSIERKKRRKRYRSNRQIRRLYENLADIDKSGFHSSAIIRRQRNQRLHILHIHGSLAHGFKPPLPQTLTDLSSLSYSPNVRAREPLEILQQRGKKTTIQIDLAQILSSLLNPPDSWKTDRRRAPEEPDPQRIRRRIGSKRS